MAERDPPTLGTISRVCIYIYNTELSKEEEEERKKEEEASYIYVYYKYQTGRKRVASSILREREKRGK